MTADIADPATAAFVLTGATDCAACYATPGSAVLAAQAVELCSPRSIHPDDFTHCALVPMVGVDVAARTVECETEQVDGASRCIYVAAAAPGARGYSDDDSTSGTACLACAAGEYVSTDAVNGVCSDFDECAHDNYPCENGAVCTQRSASFTCTCDYGFSGNLCQLLDECALSPCTLTTVEYALTDVSTPATNRFLCPVNMRCQDPDQTTTDDYVCTCPACTEMALSASTATALSTYFNAHPSFSRFVARGAQQIVDPSTNSFCKVSALEGCMDPLALNFDRTASVSRPDLCIARVYGCMDKRAINFDAQANSYDPTGSDPATLCHGAYCKVPAGCASILTDQASIDACALADVSSADSKVAMDSCEAAGAPGTAVYQPGVGVHEHDTVEHASVCRYVPETSALCPYTAGDGAAYTPNTCAPMATTAECSAASMAGTPSQDQQACVVAIPGCEVVADACVPTTSACATADLSGTDAEDATRCGLIAGCQLESVAHDGDCACPVSTTKVVLGPNDSSIDECAQIVYDGGPMNACAAGDHRLCGQDHGDMGTTGRHCTDFRRAFVCPDHVTDNTCQPLATTAQCALADMTGGVVTDNANCVVDIPGCKVVGDTCVPKAPECAAAFLGGTNAEDAQLCSAIAGCGLVASTTDAFTCVDPNLYWQEDYSCSCAYTNGLCKHQPHAPPRVPASLRSFHHSLAPPLSRLTLF